MTELESSLSAVLDALPVGKSVYLSVDVDAFDPAVLPGTSSPEPDGLSYALAMQLIRAVTARNTLVGLDVVELAPNLDPSGRSELIAARLIMETLCEALDDVKLCSPTSPSSSPPKLAPSAARPCAS